MHEDEKDNIGWTLGALTVGLAILGYLGCELHTEMLISGWAVNKNGDWKLVATGWEVYKYSWISMLASGVIGTTVGYLVGVPVGRLATKKDIARQQEEITSNALKLAEEREILKEEKYSAEDTYRAGNSYMQQAEIITREADRRVATAMKQIEKMKNELKGARARAFRKIKRLKSK